MNYMEKDFKIIRKTIVVNKMKFKNKQEFYNWLSVSRKGQNNPCWRGGLPKCLDCGKELRNYNNIRCKSCSNKKNNLGRKRPQWEKEKISKTMKKLLKDPTKNPSWKGGISFEPYPPEFNKKIREEIRKRDNYTCQNCNMLEEEQLTIMGYILSVHHIDYDKKNSNKNNLITLCHWCNLKANINRDYWVKYYSTKKGPFKSK